MFSSCSRSAKWQQIITSALMLAMRNNHLQVSKKLFDLLNKKNTSDEPYFEIYFKRYFAISNSLVTSLGSRQAKQQKLRQVRDKEVYRNFICSLLHRILTNGDSDASASNSTEPLPDDEDLDLDCPVCFEFMGAPRKIFSCHNGHLLCSVCLACPKIQACPLCRDDFKVRKPRRDMAAEEKARKLQH